MKYDRILARLAAAQHGVVSQAQARGAGVPLHALRQRVSAGRLEALHARVYALAGVPPSFHRALVASCLAACHSAVASHRAAAVLWGLAEVDPRIEISVVNCHQPAIAGAQVHRVRSLDPVDVTKHQQIPVTRPARTIVDLAGVLTPAALERALDDALSRRLVTCQHVASRLEALGRQGRKGAGVLRALLEARPDGRFQVQSGFEQQLLALLAAHGIQGAVPQLTIRLPSGRTARIDVAFPSARLAVEADSFAHHASLTDWSRDHIRNNELVVLGWRILPVTWDDLMHRPERVVRSVRQALCAPEVCVRKLAVAPKAVDCAEVCESRK